jgi:EAL and modified HD-GYP domain-containing signal transduction protein
VNSVACSPSTRITSIAAALMVLGRDQLRRWVQLLLYSTLAPASTFPSPLLQLAASRGKLMELLAIAAAPGDRDARERAYMAGIMSLMDTLLGQPMADVIGTLSLDDDLRGALLERSGRFGRLLALVETLDTGGLSDIDARMAEHPTLDAATVTAAQAEAFAWTNNLGKSAA